MKLTIPRSALAHVVTSASRALPHRPPIPVLAGLLLKAADNQLAVSAFDYDTSMTAATGAAAIGEPGQVLVSGRLLADIVKSLRTADVTLHTEGVRLLVESGSARFTLHTLPLEEYPTLPLTPAVSGTVNATAFAEAVAKVTVACAADDTLPVLTGVRLALEGEELLLSATDRYRFAVQSLPWEPFSGDATATALVPGSSLLDITKALPEAGNVSLALPSDAGMVGVTADNLRATTRCLEGDLPQHKKLFPDEFPSEVTVDTSELVAAVKRVALVLERNTPVTLAFLGTSLTLTGGTSDDASAEDRIACELDGAPVDISFNPAFLLDGLATIGAKQARISISAPTKPALLRAAGEPDNTGKYLIMPVRMSG
ncbi:putative DNA polymerase III beta subunit (plasmid) [Actinacidiphila reveromycinica]|uniref:Beta sliding clamp n=1 Tax=Actinacidiphila reveromycinica TaxID=659352 RepID=A0A7U3LGA1_9ACTN|nr:DNA polymerase III subunit beta [Streptomyces sp. SN-593]BBG20711.1 putative DNA polymerase III beta subunit [Streptomyces sp. SN-593]